MAESRVTVLVRANVDLSVPTLQAIVKNAKVSADANEKGIKQPDTADTVSAIITKFLEERDFEAYVKDIANYPGR